MPGYVLHLTAAKMCVDRLKSQRSDSPVNARSRTWENGFYAGNLLPDVTSCKEQSHFRDPQYRDCLIRWPKPRKFLDKYRDRMEHPVYKGYAFHLYVDKLFLRDYLPSAVRFYDQNGREAQKTSEIVCVHILRSGEDITVAQYLSEEYYYGDYTKMNTWLWERFHLPEHPVMIGDPGIGEADCGRLQDVFDELENYRKVSADAVKDVKIFDPEKLVGFLEKAVDRIIPEIFV